MSIQVILALLVLGAATGFLAGLLGIGGGMVMVPFITMILSAIQFPPEHAVRVAIATSLTTILFTSVSSVRAHHRHGAVLWWAVKSLAPGIVIGALVGAQVAGRIDSRVLAAAFAVFVGFMATQMLFRRTPAAPAGSEAAPARRDGMFGAGVGIGVVSAMVGAGGGFITVPFLASRGVKMQFAVATSAACGFPIAAAGAIGYVLAGWNSGLPGPMLGFVYLPALVVIAAASVLTAPLGARAAHAMPTAGLKRLFALLLYGVAGYMLWKALQPV